ISFEPFFLDSWATIDNARIINTQPSRRIVGAVGCAKLKHRATRKPCVDQRMFESVCPIITAGGPNGGLVIAMGCYTSDGRVGETRVGRLRQGCRKRLSQGFVKSCFGSVFKSLQKDAHQKALGKVLKELLQLVDDELRNTGVPAHQTEAWAKDA